MISFFLFRNGNLSGRVPYNARKKSKYAQQSHINARKLSDGDLLVVRKVTAKRREQHIAAIEGREAIIRNHWRPILHIYLSDANAAPPIHPPPQLGNPPKDTMAGSSFFNPLPIENVPVCESHRDIPVAREGRRRRLTLTSIDQEGPPIAKRKLNFDSEVNAHEPIVLENPEIHHAIGAFVSSEELDHVFSGEKDHGLGDIFDLSVDDFDVGEPSIDHSALIPALDQNMPPVPKSPDLPSSTNGCENQAHNPTTNEEVVIPARATHMDVSFIKEAFLNTTDMLVKKALEGLNASTLGDPQRQAVLEAISSTLPAHIPEVAKVQATLDQLIIISIQLGEAHAEFERGSEQKEHAAAEAKRELASHEATLKATAHELSSMEKCAEKAALVKSLIAQLDEASIALRELEQGTEQLRKINSSQESEVKTWSTTLLNVDTMHSKRLMTFEGKTTDLELKIGPLLENIQNWRPVSN